MQFTRKSTPGGDSQPEKTHKLSYGSRLDKLSLYADNYS